jgi:hypothetical protein
MEENKFMRHCPAHGNLNHACFNPRCEHQCYMQEKECREPEKPQSEKTWEEIMRKFDSTPKYFSTSPLQPINVHIHNDFGPLLEVLLSINQKLNQMPTKADFDAFKDQINQSVTGLGDSLANIATDITTLTNRLAGGLTPDETTAVLAEFGDVASKVQGLADAAKSIADRTPDEPTPAPTV